MILTPMWVMSSLCQALVSFKPHNHPLKQVLLLLQSYKWGHTVTTRLRNLPTEPEGGKVWIQTEAAPLLVS